MRFRLLGKTGLKVSEICLGTMTFGGRGFWKNIGTVTQKQADHLVSTAMEEGVNFFDTADIYSEGLAEEILGKAVKGRRKEVVLATKVRGQTGVGINDSGLSRHHILEGCQASLTRLKTDYVDLYQVHSFDPLTPLEETLRALDDLVRQGKVRYIGCSNYAAWQLMKAMAICGERGFERFVTLQAYYSLMGRDLENELMPLCIDQGLGILVWSPLAGGFLTGKYRRGQPRPPRARRTNPQGQFLQFDEEEGFAVIEELDRIAKAHHGTTAQAALNYLLAKPNITAVIIGARTPQQLEDNLKTVSWQMSKEEVSGLDQLTAPPRVYPQWFLAIVGADRAR